MERVTDEIFKPNGLCFSPGYKKLWSLRVGTSQGESNRYSIVSRTSGEYSGGSSQYSRFNPLPMHYRSPLIWALLLPNVHLNLVLALSAFAILPSAHGVVIYRETFGNETATRQHPNIYGWQTFDANGALFDTVNNLHAVDGTASPGNFGTLGGNINAGTNRDGLTVDGLNASRYFWAASARRLAMTPEFSFNPADYEPGSVVFSFYLGNANTTPNTDPARIAIRVGSNWFVSTTSFTSATVVSADFPALSELKSLTFNPGAVNWKIFNFDGTYNGGGTNMANDPGAIKAGASSAMSLGSNPATDLSGTITAFGVLYLAASEDFLVNNTGNFRFDTFEINAVPEPSTCMVLAFGIIGISSRRRRR